MQNTVIVMGGGHVGLSFALLLAHAGIDSIVIEKNRYPIIHPDDDNQRRHYLDARNTALSRRTVQIYQEIGLWQDLASHACRIDKVHIYEKDSFGRATLDKDEERVDSFGYVMENAHLGFGLLTAVQKNPSISLIDGVQVINITQDDDKVCVHLDSQDEPLVAKLLVACDGQSSPARDLLSVAASHYDYQQTAIVGVVKTSHPHQHLAMECFSEFGPVALLPLLMPDETAEQEHGLYRSVVWICKQGQEQRYLDDETYFLQTLQQAFGQGVQPDMQFVAAGRRGAYPLVKVLAYQQVVGRCVLMGNAAHTLHPVAGQGFNLCMRDAYTLAQMLKTGGDLGEPSRLYAYEQRRLKDQKRVIFFCDSVVQGFTSTNIIIKLCRNIGLLIFDKVPKVKPLVARFAMGLKS